TLHPNYKFPDKTLEKEFFITPREVTIEIKDQDIKYGDPEATHAMIGAHINQKFDEKYSVVDGSLGFLSSDTVADIFRLKLLDYNSNGLNYLSVSDNYRIGIEKLDNEVSNNYDVKIKQVGGEIAYGVFKVTPAEASFVREQLVPGRYTGEEQKVSLFDSQGNVTLQGDAEELKKTMTVSYSFTGADGTFDANLKVKDSGTYGIYIKIAADNHDVYVTEKAIRLEINKAYVEISMDSIKKTYGDTLEEILQEAGVDNISDWLKLKCKITYRTYDNTNGENYDVVGVDKDFSFKVVEQGQGNGKPLEIGTNDVGFYRVYHKGDVAEGNDTMKNYEVVYKNSCHAKAYEIIQRKVDVEWETTGYVGDDKNVFEYSGKAPDIKAYIQLVGNEAKRQEVSITSEPRENKAKISSVDVGPYTATASDDNSFQFNEFAKNYEFGNKTFDFEIVAKKVTVTILNDSAEYGEEKAKVGYVLDSTRYVTDSGETLPMTLKLDVTAPEGRNYYNVGEYHIVGSSTNNYDVTYKGEGTDNAYAIFKVNPAELRISSEDHSTSYTGSDYTVDLKDILSKKTTGSGEPVYNVKGDMTWADAVVLYKQEDGTYSETMPVIKGITYDSALGTNVGKTIVYKVQLDNYDNDKEFTFTIHVTPAELVVNVSKGASSVYGDDLLTSDELFEKANITLDSTNSSITGVDLKSIIKITVLNSGDNFNVRDYNIGYEFINAEDSALYSITLAGEVNAYAVTPRELTVKWNYNGAFEYDGAQHTITAELLGTVGEDVVNINGYQDNAKTSAGDYVASITSVDNSNYTLGNDAKLEWKIAPKAIKVVWTAGDFTYNKEAHLLDAPEIEAGQLIGSDGCDIIVEYDDNVNAGDHIATAKTSNDNYVVENDTYSYNIKPAVINVEWNTDGLTYNGKKQAPTAAVVAGQLFEGDECNVTVSDGETHAGIYT
ncbi:MAG: hypothetical protein K2L53_03850, partial [Clostridia bacterium]|nr:hypothetical protein [Clostridia bacterium]